MSKGQSLKVARDATDDRTVVSFGEGHGVVACAVGGRWVPIIAGQEMARWADRPARHARGVVPRSVGALCVRHAMWPSAPYDPRGGGALAMPREVVARIRSESGLPVLVEVGDARELDRLGAVDGFVIGERHMQDFALLSAIGERDIPVLLERGVGATIRELIMAAEHVLVRGNRQVVLCERGLRTFETARCVLDLAAVPLLKCETHLPIVVDVTHAFDRAGAATVTGVRSLAMAAVAAGADALLLGVRELENEGLRSLVRSVRTVARVIDRGDAE